MTSPESGAEEAWDMLPDWANNVPMHMPHEEPVLLGDDRTIAPDILRKALDSEVGEIIGSLSIAPELRDTMAQFTENPAWLHLPTEPTSIERTADDTWEIAVGSFRKVINRTGIQELLPPQSPQDQQGPSA